jgi:hypothetical protein
MTMMKSISSIMSIVCICSLLNLGFFHDVGFMGETFILLEVSSLSIGSLGGVTSPCFFLSYSPLSSSLYTSSSPPPLGESEVVSSNVLFNSYTSSFFFLLLLLGASYSLRVTIGLLMRLGLDNSAWSTGIRRYVGHSLVISSVSSRNETILLVKFCGG